ncbi:MAG: NAD(P)-dependent oxidoreductase [Promethearchaeota archaeon]|nr:MAG: NAD(P)-dependent oxidoreductase [Candidatus Lokiarchaeota archaeon]
MHKAEKGNSKLNVVITGASGNIGIDIFKKLLSITSKINLRIFSRGSKKNRKLFKPYMDKIEVVWGNILDSSAVKRAINGQDIVIHLAGIIPPICYEDNDYTYEVNVKGTKKIVDAMRESDLKPKIIYSSSLAVYGDRLDKPYIENDAPLNPNDIYGYTKVKAENLIRTSGCDYIIFRLAYCASIRTLRFSPVLFLMPLDTPLEAIDTRDIGTAIVNAIFSENVWNNTYDLGGGKDCRITYREHLNDLFKIMGCGKNLIPEELFNEDGYYIGYCDTLEIQNFLNFQHHNLEDYYEIAKQWIGIKRYFTPLVKPIIKWYLKRKLKKSKIREIYRKSQEKLKKNRELEKVSKEIKI